jgi:methylmalonyl-CoA/ethylmalonyl-CoA epimerase
MKFRHLGVAVPKIDQALDTYVRILGYKQISEQFDDPIQKVTVCFLGRSDPREPCIELVSPLTDDSPVSGVLKRGGGAYHMCFETEDLDARLVEVVDKGCLLVYQPAPAIAFGGKRIAWVYTPTRQLIELLEGDK